MLAEVLDWAEARGALVNVELKHDTHDKAALVRGVARLLGGRSKVAERVMFSTFDPEILARVALALPRSVDRWVYDVLEEEPVATSFGAVNAFHLKPRRVSRPGGELIAEVWFAPQLRYLPARIRIEQDRETFIDLVLSRRPELAGP